MRLSKLFSSVALSVGMIVAGASASSAEVKIKLMPLATGLNAPLAMVQPAGDDRKFVIEQFGRIKIISADGTLQPTPFLDIRNLIVNQFHDFDERGLLGLTFHPDFKTNGKFYIAYSANRVNNQGDLGKMFWWDHTNTVAEFTVSADDPDVADMNTYRIISQIDWPQFNHNGHWLSFGKDGYLYMSVGDGGYANDWGIGHNVTEGNGQDTTVLHGKILRIDVNSKSDGNNYGIPADNPFVGDDDIRSEIYAYGFRNPWRCSFDMKDGRLFCGDVQQNSYEEIDIVEAGKNYGWRKKESVHCFDYAKPDNHPASCDSAGLVDPILTYKNCTAQPDGCNGISITGGYVYRGSHKDWDGKYIFGDWSKSFSEMDGQIFFGTEKDGKWSMEVASVVGMDGKKPYILSFAQDADGEVYALTSITTGPNGSLDTIYKVVPAN